MRTRLLKELVKQAKQTEMHMIGVDIKKYNLTRKEKRSLVDRGLHFSGGRNNRSLLLYPQELRSRDLKKKVYKKRRRKINEK